jgi:hypothetical protein
MHKLFYFATSILAFAISATTAVANGPLALYNPSSNNCLQPENGSTVQGAAIVQQPCSNSSAQRWNRVSESGGVFHYQNVLSGLCLDARGSAANGTPVQLWACNTITNENWQPVDGNNELQSRVSGTSAYCLDAPGAQTTAGLALQIYSCNGTVAQIWEFAPSSKVTVPSVDGSNLSAAVKAISAAGLVAVVNKQKDCISPGEVISQYPDSGTLAAPGSNVSITFDTGTKSTCPIIK